MNGVLLIATGRQHLEEARLCIRSIRALSDLPITIFTDPSADVPATVHKVDRPSFSWDDKPRWTNNLPYERTLFLDTDTLLLRREALEVFDLLDRFDIALAHAPARCHLAMNDVPECFPEFNSGVIALRKSEVVLQTLRRWQETHDAMKRRGLRAERGGKLGDQTALRRVIYGSRVRIATLPPEYNYRGLANASIARCEEIRILHNREVQSKALASNGSIDWPEIQSWFKETIHPSERR